MDTRTHRTSAILRTITAGAILAGTLASSSGCQVANQALRADFTDFNTILQSNQTQQMLLNLVRMHYRETPLFMQAGSLTASYESSISADSSASIPAGDPSSIDIGGSYRFSSKPTISYTPVEGKEYVQQFMAEITPQTFAMLVRAGWPISKLGELLVASVTLDSGERLVGRPSAASNPRFREFFETLKASGTLTIGVERFQFRSLFSAMFNASRDVQTPASRASWAKSTPGGQEIDVRVSDKPPVDALVCVEYAGSYYSIANDDIRSKDTLALLMQLSRIQSGPSAPAPLITIPAR
jgi:hypothetical protein